MMMKRIIAGLALAALMALPASAQIAISQLPSATVPLQGSEVVAGVQNGQTVQIPQTAIGVQGPSSATSGHVATFSGTTGKLIQDGGATPVTSVTCFGVAITTTGTCTTTGQLPGTATNDNGSAGKVGEYISSTVLVGSPVSLSNGVSADVTSISLTAGDWDVCGNVLYTLTTATVTDFQEWISATSATKPTPPNGGSYTHASPSLTSSSIPDAGYSAGCMRQSLSGTTTVYLSTQAAFSGTVSAYGFIGARRAR